MQLMLQLRQFAVHVHDGAAHLRRQPGAAGADALGALAQLPQVVVRLADTQLVPGLDGFPGQVRLPVEPLYAVAQFARHVPLGRARLRHFAYRPLDDKETALDFICLQHKDSLPSMMEHEMCPSSLDWRAYSKLRRDLLRLSALNLAGFSRRFSHRTPAAPRPQHFALLRLHEGTDAELAAGR